MWDEGFFVAQPKAEANGHGTVRRDLGIHMKKIKDRGVYNEKKFKSIGSRINRDNGAGLKRLRQ